MQKFMPSLPSKRILTIAASVVVPLTIASTAFAANAVTSTSTVAHPGLHQRLAADIKPSALGTVSAVSGSTITIRTRNGSVYAVDAASAKITKGSMNGSQTLTPGEVLVGDQVIVFGTATGSNISATSIVDAPTKPQGVGKGLGIGHMKPGIEGSIAAINGSSFTVSSPVHRGPNATSTSSTASTTTFTVNTTATTTYKNAGATTTASALTVGARVRVRGAIDQAAKTVTATQVDLGMPTLPGKPHRTTSNPLQ